jgi:hypothetical protein
LVNFAKSPRASNDRGALPSTKFIASNFASCRIPVDLTPLRILEIIRTAITAPDAVNFVSAAIAECVTSHD